MEYENKTLKITTPEFDYMKKMPVKFSCKGEDVNPRLEIEGVPVGTKSLVLIIDDPDAPMGNWDHWIVWNISADTKVIEEDSVPKGAVEGINDFGKNSYGGPCPPSGTHRYFFKLYALDKVLDLPSNSRKKVILDAIDGHILDYSELVGLFAK